MEFDKLSVGDRANILLDYGELLMNVEYYHYTTLLFDFKGEFYELVYDRTIRQIMLVRVIERSHALQKYLDLIEIRLW